MNQYQSVDTLREYLRIASSVLGRERLARPSRVAVAERRIDPSHQATVEYVKHLCWVAASSYGISLPQVIVALASTEKAAGHIAIEGGICFIDIDPAHAFDNERLLSIVAHEVAHIALAVKGVTAAPLQRLEEITDAIAVLGGFGEVMLNALYRETTSGFLSRTVHRSKLGYLTSRSIRYLLKLQRRIDPAWHGIRHRPWPSHPQSWCCDVCAARVPLPKLSATIIVRCGTCGRYFQLTLSREMALGVRGLFRGGVAYCKDLLLSHERPRISN